MLELKFVIPKMLKKILNPPALRECKKQKNSKVCSGSELYNTSIENYSYVGNKCFIVNTKIGNFCSIANNCCIGGAHHPIERVSSSPVFHKGKNIMRKNFAEFPIKKTPITIIENDVWLGMGCFIKAGVTIHNGAVVGMGSIVTHDIPSYEIWAGNPARKIGERFEDETKDKLNKIAWWNWEENLIKKYSNKFDNVKEFIEICEKDGLI